MSKVVFLDIDGVLNRCEYGKDLYDETYSEYCVCLHKPSVVALKKLLSRDPFLKVAWISDWAKNDNAYATSHCVISPLKALEMYPWLKGRVCGSVFTGKHTNASNSDKMLAIKDFIVKHCIGQYAVIDDNKYEWTNEIKHLSKHFVHIDSLKSFLEDDLSRVEDALSLPIDGEVVHSVLLAIEHGASVVVNGRYRCTFISNGFSSFSKSNVSPRVSSEAELAVYDIDNSKSLDGMLMLNIDEDLNSRHSATLYTKDSNDSKWSSGVKIHALTVE